jgi:hypothetical protein
VQAKIDLDFILSFSPGAVPALKGRPTFRNTLLELRTRADMASGLPSCQHHAKPFVDFQTRRPLAATEPGLQGSMSSRLHEANQLVAILTTSVKHLRQKQQKQKQKHQK